MRGWRTLRLDGSTNRAVRELDIRDFNSFDEDHFVYLIMTRAGGVGVNLASANHVVLFDIDHNPLVDRQAIDRAHRIGQTRVVRVYQLISEWGVEEHLAHRRGRKLRLERSVMQISDDTQPEALATGGEKLSAAEVLAVLQHGEQVLQAFPGESLVDHSLGRLLKRRRRPMPAPPEVPPPQEVELDPIAVLGQAGRGSTACATIERAECENADGSAALSTRTPESKSAAVAGVVRTSSGREVRRPQPFINVQTPTKASTRGRQSAAERPELRHDTTCFACGGGADLVGDAVVRSADSSRSTEPPDMWCRVCPRAYHSGCVRSASGLGGRWSCDWHLCSDCGRNASACGGVIIHCVGCPISFCPDCFPPEFRRVHPPRQFWSDLNGRGWKATPETMLLFRCNSCRASEESRLQRQMNAEDLEAMEEDRWLATVEEKDRLAAAKRRLEEGEESRKQMTRILREHDRAGLHKKLQTAKEEVLHSAERLWPPNFRSRWLAKYNAQEVAHEVDGDGGCAGGNGGNDVAMVVKQPVGLTRKKCNDQTVLVAAILCCNRCGFPGHADRNCPFPAENVSKAVDVHGNGRRTYRRVCALCEKSGHQRSQCSQITVEHRRQYEERLQVLDRLLVALRAVSPLPEPVLETDIVAALAANSPPQGVNGTDGVASEAELFVVWGQVAGDVEEVVLKKLHRCGPPADLAEASGPLLPKTLASLLTNAKTREVEMPSHGDSPNVVEAQDLSTPSPWSPKRPLPSSNHGRTPDARMQSFWSTCGKTAGCAACEVGPRCRRHTVACKRLQAAFDSLSCEEATPLGARGPTGLSPATSVSTPSKKRSRKSADLPPYGATVQAADDQIALQRLSPRGAGSPCVVACTPSARRIPSKKLAASSPSSLVLSC
eukprot:TRINITY_DN12901_c2_g3_i2.p1 TRINITY_DN12901_c2_g3~~TRINITY_DN12901_c2_g3_i2.p1  ORF type:complete len:953 (-),score=144.85 TRINITY_DN12901_c2_g3_i2:404-3076(-)